MHRIMTSVKLGSLGILIMLAKLGFYFEITITCYRETTYNTGINNCQIDGGQFNLIYFLYVP